MNFVITLVKEIYVEMIIQLSHTAGLIHLHKKINVTFTKVILMDIAEIQLTINLHHGHQLFNIMVTNLVLHLNVYTVK